MAGWHIDPVARVILRMIYRAPRPPATQRVQMREGLEKTDRQLPPVRRVFAWSWSTPGTAAEAGAVVAWPSLRDQVSGSDRKPSTEFSTTMLSGIMQ